MFCKNFMATNIAAICCASLMTLVGCSKSSNTVAANTDNGIDQKDAVLGDVRYGDADATTLENYVAQFTDDPNELSFDSHVLAYNGNFPMIIMPLDSLNADPGYVAIDNTPIVEINASDVARYFPKTAEVAGNRLNQENCKLYVVKIGDGGQPTGHVLTKVSQGEVESTGVHQGGFHVVTSAYFTVAYLVQDCEGLIDKNSKITYKGFSSRTWCGDIMKSDEELMVGDSLVLGQDIYKPNPDCVENAHLDVVAYGEWFRADLAQ